MGGKFQTGESIGESIWIFVEHTLTTRPYATYCILWQNHLNGVQLNIHGMLPSHTRQKRGAEAFTCCKSHRCDGGVPTAGQLTLLLIDGANVNRRKFSKGLDSQWTDRTVWFKNIHWVQIRKTKTNKQNKQTKKRPIEWKLWAKRG